MAISEARRCLNCKNKPCVPSCPVMIDIPAFIEKVAHDDMPSAYDILSADHGAARRLRARMPAGGTVRAVCVRGKKAKASASADWNGLWRTGTGNTAGIAPVKPAPNGHKVAVIGAGPAGLACAGDLAKLRIRHHRFSKRCTCQAACWYTASPNSVCPRRS